MKKCLFLALIVSSLNAQPANFTSTQNGNWLDGATWGKAGNTIGVDYPGANDQVTIDGHNIICDIPGVSATIFDEMTFKGSGSLTMSGSTGIVVRGDVNLNFPISMGSNTRFRVEGNFQVNSGGSITFTDRTSIFTVTDNGLDSATINGDLIISNGIFAIQGNGNNNVSLDSSGSITVNEHGALYFESNNVTFTVNGPIIVNNGGVIVNNTDNNSNVTFKYGSSYYRENGKSKLNFNNKKPVWEIAFDNSTVESKGFSQTLSKFDGITFIKVSLLKAGTQVVKTIQ